MEVIKIVPQRDVTDDDIETRTISEIPRTTVEFPADATTREWMSVAEASGSLDFWNAPEEDKYDEEDGEPL